MGHSSLHDHGNVVTDELNVNSRHDHGNVVSNELNVKHLPRYGHGNVVRGARAKTAAQRVHKLLLPFESSSFRNRVMQLAQTLNIET